MEFFKLYGSIFLRLTDIFLVLLVINSLWKMMKGTKGIFFLNAIIILLLVYMASKALNFELFSSLLEYLMIIMIVGMPILFPMELKKAVESLGTHNPIAKFFIKPPTIATESIEVVAEAAESLSRKRIGGLLVFEWEDSLLNVVESGLNLDAVLSKILLEQIFYPNSPLHDGAILVKGNRIRAAGCFLPLDNQLFLPHNLGSRHRAGLTISAQTDALVVIVSEETGEISIAYKGCLFKMSNAEQVKIKLKEITMESKTENKNQNQNNNFNSEAGC